MARSSSDGASRLDPPMPEREVLEGAVLLVSEQAAATAEIVADAMYAGMGGSHPVMIEAKMLRRTLLELKADLECELADLVLDCRVCNQRIHYVAGLGSSPGHWAHREPAPHHQPVI